MKKIILLQTSLLLLNLALPVYSEEDISIRQEKKNSVTLGVDSFFYLGTQGFAPLLSLTYKRNFTENLSTGISLKTLLIYNGLSVFQRYYFNQFKTRNSSFYVDLDLNYTNMIAIANSDGSTNYGSLSLNPELGYEHIFDNGFTASAGLGYGIIQYSLDSKNFSFSPLAASLNANLGYSF